MKIEDIDIAVDHLNRQFDNETESGHVKYLFTIDECRKFIETLYELEKREDKEVIVKLK